MTVATFFRDATPARDRARPSLRRRLLAFLMVPILGMLVLDALLTYSVALAYSNHVHDQDLTENAWALAHVLQTDRNLRSLSPQAAFLIEYDSEGRSYYAVRSARHGLVSGSATLPRGPAGDGRTGVPRLYDTRLGAAQLRAVRLTIPSPFEHGDVLTLDLAETLGERHLRAREILWLAAPLQLLLICAVYLLTWIGVSIGLRMLEPLTTRLAQRGSDLAPIDSADIPRELLPITRTIDDLFSRLRAIMELHERFIADAAHQLRTPLAGLSLHIDRALANANDADTKDALEHIHRLGARAARIAAQLLALARAQRQVDGQTELAPLDLAQLTREAVGLRVHEAIAASVDLGYEGPAGQIYIHGDAAALHELIDNLVDNALRYAGREGTVTVSLGSSPADPQLRVEDDGPGVPAHLLGRLGERFFRAPGADEGGTGLGLAIVRRIADRHGAHVSYGHAGLGGLRAEVHFPPPASSGACS